MSGTIDLVVTEPNQIDVITIQVPGTPGSPGLKGDPGVPGQSNVLTIGTVTTGTPGSSASATITGVSPNQTLNLTIPQGPTGATGPANALTLGTVTTVDAVTGGSATITGTSPNQVLNLVLPRGYGVIPAGAAGAVLMKASATDYDTGWHTPTVGGTANAMVIRDASGQSGFQYVSLGQSPIDTTHAAPKGYVDTGDSNTLTSANAHSDTKASIAGDIGGTAALPQVTGGTHHSHTSSQISDAASAATASTVLIRDANGRAQVTDPSAAPDIATKNYTDAGDSSTLASAKSYTDGKTPAQATTTTPGTMQIAGDIGGTATVPLVTGGTNHGHTSAQISDAASAATASKVIVRDANGRAQVVDPAVAADIATKHYVDTNAVPSNLTIGTVTTGAAGSSAAATITGTAPNQSLNLTIPQGIQGATGPAGTNGNGVLFLNSGDAVPAGTPANTVIYRPNTIKTSSFFWGSGTATPSNPAPGDTYLRTDIGTNGSIWHYVGGSSGVSGWVHKGVLVCTSVMSFGPLYAGAQRFDTDTRISSVSDGTVWTPIGVSAWYYDLDSTSYSNTLPTGAAQAPGASGTANVPPGRTVDVEFYVSQVNMAASANMYAQLYVNGAVVDGAIFTCASSSAMNMRLTLSGSYQNTTAATQAISFSVNAWSSTAAVTFYASAQGHVRLRHRIV